MSRAGLKKIADDLHLNFGVEVAVCQVFERRWSYVVGTDGFLSGLHRIKFDDEYGLILDCKEEYLQRIEEYIKQRKVQWSNEENCGN